MAEPQKRKKAKKSVVDAIAHIHASFNNTIITIPSGQCALVGDGWRLRLSRIAQVDAVRGPGRVGKGRAPRDGIRRQERRRACPWAGAWAGIGRPRPERARFSHPAHRGCHADPTQRLSPAQKASRIEIKQWHDT